MLSGEPGIGKSLIAECFIEDTGLNKFTIRKTKSDGDFINYIKNSFDEAKKSAPSIVYIDDMDKFDNVGEEVLTNKQINDMLYKELLEKKKIKRFSDFAFVHVLLLPTLMLAISIIICLIYFAFNIIG